MSLIVVMLGKKEKTRLQKREVIPRIKERAGESTDEEQKVALYGTNLGDRWRCIRFHNL
jgi:hypothetical protein